MFNRLLSTSQFSSEPQILIRNYFLAMILVALVTGFSSIFFSLYLIDLFGFYIAGFLFSVMSLSQFIFDFPTGALADYIGQRGVGTLAFICFGIGYFLYGYIGLFDNHSIVIFGFIINIFIPIMIFLGLGSALLSGVIQTWFSNNYHHLMTYDSDRSIYGAVVARIRSLFFLTTGFSVILGSRIASLYSRNLAFEINGIIGIVTGFLIYFLLRDFLPRELVPESNSISNKLKDYLSLSLGSITAIFNDRLLLVTLMGLLLITGALGSVFMRFLLLPIMFNYTGSDLLVGLSQSALMFILAFNVFFIGIFAKKFQKRSLPIFFAFYLIPYLSGLIVIILIFPQTKSLNVTALIFLVVLFLFFDSFIGEIGVNLQQRVFLDLIPTKYRNSILSLYSSLVAIIVTILYPIIGIIVENYNLIGGLLFMGFIGIIGCFLLIPIFFSTRMKVIESSL